MSKTLLQKNTRYLLIWLPVVLLVCSLLFYIVLLMHAHHMQEKQLLLKQFNVWNAFTTKSGNIERHIAGEYDIVEGGAEPGKLTNAPRDTSIFYQDRNKLLPFQILTGQMSWSGRTYSITTYVSSTEVAHLIIKIFLSEFVILLLLMLTIIILNKKSSGLLWKPFFSTMKEINDYDVTTNKSLSLPEKTGTTEFDELNKTLSQLIQNVNQAYHNQKQFVENASHEMQTPLTIIRAKLELLINQPTLTESSAQLLADITEANDRLSQMNRTLLLLSKIENNQFPDIEDVNISEELKKLINNLKNHYEEFPEMVMLIEDGIIVKANKSLIEILLSNLVNNAIVHNIKGDKINIELSRYHFATENNGLPLETDPENLFERFRKSSHQTKSTGLGLALVKQICNLYHYRVSYQYSKGRHRLCFIFNHGLHR